MSLKEENNFAFIDGQNLYMGTTKSPEKSWKINLEKFRIYLKSKYKVSRAYYFLGYVNETNRDLYEEIQEAGSIKSSSLQKISFGDFWRLEL